METIRPTYHKRQKSGALASIIRRSGELLTRSPCGSLSRRLRQRREDARPGADALVEAFQVVLFVRRMDVVVVEAKADQQAVEAECSLEVGNDRDRCAGADQERFLAPLFRQRALGGGQWLHVPVERNRGTTGVLGEHGLAVAGQARGDIITERLLDLRWVLPFDQAERDLCGS